MRQQKFIMLTLETTIDRAALIANAVARAEAERQNEAADPLGFLDVYTGHERAKCRPLSHGEFDEILSITRACIADVKSAANDSELRNELKHLFRWWNRSVQMRLRRADRDRLDRRMNLTSHAWSVYAAGVERLDR